MAAPALTRYLLYLRVVDIFLCFSEYAPKAFGLRRLSRLRGREAGAAGGKAVPA